MIKKLSILTLLAFLPACSTTTPLSFSSPFRTEVTKSKVKTKAKTKTSSWLPTWQYGQWPTFSK